jgi:hypothetical protein
LNRMLRTTVLRLMPLLAICAAAQASSIYEFGTPVGVSCGGGSGMCTGGTMSGTTTPAIGSTPGGAALYVNTTESYTVPPLAQPSGGQFKLIWSGTGDGPTLSSLIPTSWDFSLAPLGGLEAIQWDIQVVLSSGVSQVVEYDSAWSAKLTGQSSYTVAGATNVPTTGLTTMGGWQVILDVAFTPNSGSGANGATVSDVSGPAFDLGGSVPEPATWGQAGGGLLFALLMVGRKLRRR